MTQPVDFLVDGGILLDIGVRVGDIGFRLIVIIVGNKIFHGVIGKKLPEFATQLSRQRLIVGQHQGGPVQPGNHRRHGKGLSRAGNAQQRLLPQSPIDTVHQRLNGLRLISGGLIVRYELKVIHLLAPPALNSPAGRRPAGNSRTAPATQNLRPPPRCGPQG